MNVFHIEPSKMFFFFFTYHGFCIDNTGVLQYLKSKINKNGKKAVKNPAIKKHFYIDLCVCCHLQRLLPLERIQQINLNLFQFNKNVK